MRAVGDAPGHRIGWNFRPYLQSSSESSGGGGLRDRPAGDGADLLGLPRGEAADGPAGELAEPDQQGERWDGYGLWTCSFFYSICLGKG